jgi:hypothetical protein
MYSDFKEVLLSRFNEEFIFKRIGIILVKTKYLIKAIHFCGCGVAHTVAHTTPVQEDLGSILHPDPDWHFSEALISLLSDNRLINDFIHLYIVMSS